MFLRCLCKDRLVRACSALKLPGPTRAPGNLCIPGQIYGVGLNLSHLFSCSSTKAAIALYSQTWEMDVPLSTRGVAASNAEEWIRSL